MCVLKRLFQKTIVTWKLYKRHLKVLISHWFEFLILAPLSKISSVFLSFTFGLVRNCRYFSVHPGDRVLTTRLWGMTVLTFWVAFTVLFCKDTSEFWCSMGGQSPRSILPHLRPAGPLPTASPSPLHPSLHSQSPKGKAATCEAATHPGLWKEEQGDTGKYSEENRKDIEKHQRENRASKRGLPITCALRKGASPPTHAVGSHGYLLGKLLHQGPEQKGRAEKRFENLKMMPKSLKKTWRNVCQRHRHSSRRRHLSCLDKPRLPLLTILLLLRGVWLMCSSCVFTTYATTHVCYQCCRDRYGITVQTA